MKLATEGWLGGGVGARPEQRVSEADPAVTHADDVGPYRLVERAAVATAHGFDERQGGVWQSRRGCKRPARRGRQRVEPSPHQLFERDRESFSRFEPKLARAERACEL
jgi:hypothetical protein